MATARLPRKLLAKGGGKGSGSETGILCMVGPQLARPSQISLVKVHSRCHTLLTMERWEVILS